jgi:hypothetical protein
MKKRRKRSRKQFKGKGAKLNTVKGGEFETKSTYETKYVEILEADPDVVRFVYEPFKIQYHYGKKKRKRNYIPDFLVEYSDGREELIEIKPKKLLSMPKNQAKIKAGEDHEIAFRVVTEADLGL